MNAPAGWYPDPGDAHITRVLGRRSLHAASCAGTGRRGSIPRRHHRRRRSPRRRRCRRPKSHPRRARGRGRTGPRPGRADAGRRRAGGGAAHADAGAHAGPSPVAWSPSRRAPRHRSARHRRCRRGRRPRHATRRGIPRRSARSIDVLVASWAAAPASPFRSCSRGSQRSGIISASPTGGRNRDLPCRRWRCDRDRLADDPSTSAVGTRATSGDPDRDFRSRRHNWSYLVASRPVQRCGRTTKAVDRRRRRALSVHRARSCASRSESSARGARRPAPPESDARRNPLGRASRSVHSSVGTTVSVTAVLGRSET